MNLAADLNLAAPIDGAVAANANVAAPDRRLGGGQRRFGRLGRRPSISQQDAIITQNLDANADATADQTSTITQ